MKLDIFTQTGSKKGTVSLDPGLFDVPVNESLITQFLRVYAFNQHGDTASTKTRTHVRGGGRKPWRQKGTGRARHGSIRSPLWVGGGVTHGPKPHPTMRINRKMQRSALFSALSQKRVDGKITVIDALSLDAPSTKEVVTIIEKLSVSKPLLVVVPDVQQTLQRSVNNLQNVSIMRASDLNAYAVLRHDAMLIIEPALSIMKDTFLSSDVKKVPQKNVEDATPNELTSLDLSTRSLNALEEAGITTLAELKTKTKDQLVEIKGLGAKSIESILEAIS